MRKPVLLVAVWAWSALAAPAAEKKPFVVYRPADSIAYCQPCNPCQTASCPEKAKKKPFVLFPRKDDASCLPCAAASCPEKAKKKPFVLLPRKDACTACPKSPKATRGNPCGDSSCEKEKECKLTQIVRWLCFVPARTRCEKQPQPCCTPPMYLYFLCCQPACGATAPCVGCRTPSTCCEPPAACRSCR